MIAIRTKDLLEYRSEKTIRVSAIKKENDNYFLKVGSCENWYKTDKQSYDYLKKIGTPENE